MTETQISTESFFVPLNKLDRDPKNVRKTYSKEGITEMAATIRADGYRLLQNIIVRKGDKRGRFFVTAGERRRAALLLLADAGEIAKDFPVECKERSEAEATEISIIENMSREAMHPVDEYEAYRVMAEDGKSVEDIAARFGTTETMVRKRLALGRVSPVLLELHRQEEMTFQQLSAFTVSDDHDRQVEVWNSLPSWNCDHRAIRSALQAEAVKATDKRMKFIGGLDAYEAAGGTVKRDLFDDQNGGYALDVALVEKLVADRLEAEAEAVRAEGWKWVEVVPVIPSEAVRMHRVYPSDIPLTEEEQAEEERLEAEYDELVAKIEAGEADDEAEPRTEAIQARLAVLSMAQEAYSPEEIAKAGCYVTMDYYGNVEIEQGLVRPDDEAVEEGVETGGDTAEGDADETDEGGATVPPKPEQRTEPPFKMPALLVQELTAQKTAAIRAELAHNPDVALAAVVHAMLVNIFGSYGGSDYSSLEVTVKSERLETSIADPAACPGIVAMDELKENYGHTIPGKPSELLEWCLEQPTSTLLELLAYAAAKSVNAVQHPHYERKSQRAHAERLAQALKIDMTQWYAPTGENYFARISKAGIKQAVTEAVGEDLALGVLGMEKAKAVEYAERKITGTGWLPAPVRIALTAEQECERMVEATGDDDGVCPFDIDNAPVTGGATFPEAAE
ncbi:ParB/RepB/Spo0J family partition protein [Rhizobium daejeonense]|uniref:ParB/RepB/Spo0J family partition protein n=1 Tax=Rhizobium daejeonense TaxID=240521 RepID=A0A6M1SIF3_9HYPH|nr:ParB/RepB/Spo0J family partition protein [Rhizobium daejeonense]NGO66586.1 ParB/RepB/Spo0J family partition protein [Rhizobium daejeonense]